MNTYKITSENKTRELGTVTAKDAISALEEYCQTAGIAIDKNNRVGILVDYATHGVTWACVLTISDGRISADRVTGSGEVGNRFAPAPWTISKEWIGLDVKSSFDGRQWKNWSARIKSGDRIVATCDCNLPHRQDEGHPHASSVEEWEANANLIAAAPDLLSAAHEAADYLAGDNCGGVSKTLQDAIEKAEDGAK